MTLMLTITKYYTHLNLIYRPGKIFPCILVDTKTYQGHKTVCVGINSLSSQPVVRKGPD